MQEQRRFKVVKYFNILYFLVYFFDNILWEEIICYILLVCLCSILFFCNELLMIDEFCIDFIDYFIVFIKKNNICDVNVQFVIFRGIWVFIYNFIFKDVNKY